MTIAEAIAARIAKLTDADLQEYAQTADQLIWVEYNILDHATENGLSNRYAELAEDMLIEANPNLA